MRQMRGWVLMIGALMFVMVILLPFFVMAQEAAVSAAPASSGDALTVIAVAALAVSEALALIPQLKANGVLHLIILALNKFLNKPVASMVLVIGLAAGLSGCAGLPKFSEVAPTVCSYATNDEARNAAKALLAKLPPGTDKDRAIEAERIAEVSADAACVLVKALEAKKPAS